MDEASPSIDMVSGRDERARGRAKRLQRPVLRQEVCVHGFNNAAEYIQCFPVVGEPIDGTLGNDERFFGDEPKTNHRREPPSARQDPATTPF